MSDFDEKDIIKDSGDSDFDPADIHTESAKVPDTLTSKNISKLESAIQGGRQGITGALGDEGVGAGGAALDSVQSLLNTLGIAGPSPSQVNAKLKDSGVTGDVGPTTAGEIYDQFRDEDRAQMEAAAKANPLSFAGGALVGGMASMPLIPTSVLSPLGSVAKTAPLLEKIAHGAVNAAPLGALAGFGGSKADNPMDMANDIASGGLLAGAVGGAIPAIGAGIKGAGNLAGEVIPDSVKDAYQRGKEGVKIGAQSFYDDVTGRLKDAADMVSKPIRDRVAKQEATAAAQAEKAAATKAADTAKIESQMSQMQDEADRALELSTQKQTAQNADDVANLNKETTNVAQRLQKRIFDVKKVLGEEFDRIEDAAAKAGIAPENEEIITSIISDLQTKSNLTPSQIKSISTKLSQFINKKDPTSYKDLKALLADYSQHESLAVQKIMLKGQRDLRNNYVGTMRANNYDQLADDLLDTNRRWSSAMDLEDFVDKVNPNRLTGNINPTRKTFSSVKDFSGKTPEQIEDAKQFQELLNVLDPKAQPQAQALPQVSPSGAPIQGAVPQAVGTPASPMAGNIQDMGQVTADLAAAKAAKPLELPRGINPEADRLQNMLNQVKAQPAPTGPNPSQIPGLDLPVNNPEALTNSLLNTLPKAGMNAADDVAEKRLAQTFNFLDKDAPEVAKELQAKLPQLNKDVALRNKVNGITDDEVPLSVNGIMQKITGGTLKAANKAGEIVQGATDFMQKGVKILSDANPEQMQVLAARLSQQGPEGVQYARVLAETAGKNRQSKNAIIFGLMQQPKFRELFHSVNHEKSGE